MKRFALVISVFVLFAVSLQTTSAATFNDLTSYQKQKYWDMMDKDCIPLLNAQKYTDYRTCALNVLDKASKLVEAKESWCLDSDGGADYLKKGIVKSDLYPAGVEDYVYTFANGAKYLFEGVCSSDNHYFYYQKNCSELGAKYFADVAAGACVLKNVAPVIEAVGDKTVKEGELLKFEVKANDADGDQLTYGVDNLPAGATFVGNTFSWTPNYKQAGDYKVSFSVDDGTSPKIYKEIKITVVKGGPNLIWNNNYGGVEYNGFEDAVKTSDGGYVVAGATMVMDSNDPDIWAVKVDADGKVIWDKIYKTKNDQQSAEDIEPTSDGGFIIVGHSDSIYNGPGKPANIAKIIVIKIDSLGNIEWTKKIGEEDSITYTGEAIMKSPGGGYAITGRICDPKQACAVIFVKVSDLGDIEWQKIYKSSLPVPPTSPGTDTEIYSGYTTKDGGYILGATFSNAIDGQQFWFIKTDKDGNIQWQNYYGDQYYQKLKSIKQTSDGGYIAVGYTQLDNGTTDIWVVKTDNNGNKEWDENFGGPNSDDGTDVIQTLDGGFVVTGRYNDGQIGHGWVIKIDKNGNQEWDFKNVAKENVDSNTIYDASQNSDESYVFFGSAASFQFEANQGWIFKIK